MGVPLTGTNIATTYSGYIKTSASAALVSPVILSDGQGNDTALTLAPASGASSFSGALTSLGNFTVGSSAFVVTAASGNITSTGSLTLTGGVTVNTNKFTVAAATGNTVIAGTLLTSGAATFSSTGAFSGNLSTSQTLTCRSFVQNDVAGSNALSGTLTVTGAATFNGSVQLNSSVSFAQTATFSAGITAPTFTATSSSALGTASAGSLTTTGAVNCGGNLSVTGNATVNGNATLGDAAGDALTINAATVSAANLPVVTLDIANDRVIVQDASDSNRLKVVTAGSFVQSGYNSGNIDFATQLTNAAPAIVTNHGLASSPLNWKVFFECTTAHNDWLVGDRLPYDAVYFDTWGNAVFQFSVNSTNWTFQTNQPLSPPQVWKVQSRYSGNIGVSFVKANWCLRVLLKASF